jgi:hypothetical protein
LEEQASYIIQNAALAFMAEAEVVFHFQLYDDCGNHPEGTTFSPHDGFLCSTGVVCVGDAFGMIRNDTDNVCFNQGLEPNSKRPAYTAFRTMSGIFGDSSVTPLQMFNVGSQRWLVFSRPQSSELMIFIWDESGRTSTAVVKARSENATVITQDGTRQSVVPNAAGNYEIPLAPATNRNAAPGSGIQYMIGGKPVILIQQTSDPFVSVLPILDRSRQAFIVKWRSNRADLSNYQVWYRDDSGSGQWVLWLDNASGPGEALFIGTSGRRYSFFARAKTPDGAWSREEPEVQASTQVE